MTKRSKMLPKGVTVEGYDEENEDPVAVELLTELCGPKGERLGPRPLNPEPEPGVDITTSYEGRFRDPLFIQIWTRWWGAREAWSMARLCVPFDQGGPDMLYDPVPELIKKPYYAAQAQEFQLARRAYLDDVKRRSDPQG